MSAVQYAYDVFYDLIDKVLNTDLSLGVTLVQAHQDAPAPALPYIAIELPAVSQEGHTHSTEVQTPSGNIGRVDNWTGTIGIWQVGGDGDLLRTLFQRLGFQTIKDFMVARKVAIFSTPDTAYLPRTEEQTWVREWRAEVRFGMAVQANETIGWIETAEISPEHLGGLQ